MESTQLLADGIDHIIYTNRDEIPDMKSTEGILKLFQLEGEKNQTPTGEWHLTVSEFQCSCTSCRQYLGPNDCLYKLDRNVRVVEVSEKKDTVPEPDPFEIANMTVAQLKEELRYRYLKITGLKAELRFRLGGAPIESVSTA